MIISRDLAPRRSAPAAAPRPRKVSTIIKDLEHAQRIDIADLDRIYTCLLERGFKPGMEQFDAPQEPQLQEPTQEPQPAQDWYF